ncbi:hypothetical protein AB0H23_32610 [Streptomyces albogriseolus]|uniref:hypothetical protein n=1 Tax=Streptomyces albogriseolus TaxID=1887 RepID=UPI0034603485
MSTPVPPVTEPDKSTQSCPSDQIGPCAMCQRPTHKYGHGARSPLCEYCDKVAVQKWGRPLRAARAA